MSLQGKANAAVAVQPARDESAPVPKPARLLSLDVFRGITLAGMVLVNNHGSESHIYPPLAHMRWNGWTFTDLIFPFFIFIVGVAIPYSFAGRLARGAGRGELYGNILRRTLILFALGLFLNGFPNYNLATLRIFGILQRIALCYCCAAVIYLQCRPRTQAAIGAGLLIFYFVMMKFVPVPGYGAGVLEPEGNWAQYIDVRVLAGHMMHRTWEGKGLLGTLPAISTALIGLVTGQYLRSAAAPLQKAVNLYFFGAAGLFLGALWSLWFPINQNLWTSSLVVFMGGMALVVLASCYYVVDIRRINWWTKPCLVFGLNSITVWVLSSLVMKSMELIRIAGPDGKPMDLRERGFEWFASWAGPWNGSLLFAFAYVLFFLAAMGILYRRKIFLKI